MLQYWSTRCCPLEMCIEMVYNIMLPLVALTIYLVNFVCLLYVLILHVLCPFLVFIFYIFQVCSWHWTWDWLCFINHVCTSHLLSLLHWILGLPWNIQLMRPHANITDWDIQLMRRHANITDLRYSANEASC